MKHSALVINSAGALKNALRPCPLRRGLVVVSCTASLACLLFSPTARAVLDPPPDGGYANNNTAEGENAFFDTDINNSSDNTALGFDVLHFADVIFGDTAVGSQAMEFGAGNFNVAVGFEALFQSSGNDNTAVGASAMGLNGLGNNNTAVGNGALFFNDSGNSNACLGFNALANNTGSSNIAIGESAGKNLTNGKNNIDIGNAGNAGESAKIRIGNKAQKNTFIAGISGVTVAGGVGVIIDTNGQLGTVTSSARYKEAIKPMDKASEAILGLKPVSFRYKKELDPAGIPQFGLVAEDVAKVAPDLVARDEEGKPYTVRYEAVNAMLLNEFLKAHRTIEEQQGTISGLKSALAQQEKEIKALRAGLQQVGNQLELMKPAARVVAGN